MAFGKTEIKQLKELFIEQGKGFDQKLDQQDKRTDKKIDNLAIITAKGFEESLGQFTQLKKRVNDGFSNVYAHLDLIEKDIRDIRQKMHPAMDKNTYLELEERVTTIEEKLGISY